MRNLQGKSMVIGFKVKYIIDRRFKPELNVMESQCKAAQKIIKMQNTKIHLVESNKHQVNAAKWAIQMFKNLFITGLNTIDINFPMELWNELLIKAHESPTNVKIKLMTVCMCYLEWQIQFQ